MSQDNSQSTKKTTIKIAAKDASQRNSNGADPGPGDMSAAPSVAPQLVDIPDPPTGSQLVVKSTTSGAIPTMHEGRSGTLPSSKGPKSIIQASMSGTGASAGGSKHLSGSKQHSSLGSQAGPAASQPSAAREPTSSRQLTGPPGSNLGAGSGAAGPTSSPGGGSEMQSVSGRPASNIGGSVGGASGAAGGSQMGSAPKSVSASGPKSTTGAAGAGTAESPSAPPTASTAMQADSGVVHDEDEEGEGELEQPDGSPSPAASASPKSVSGASGSGAGAGPGASTSAQSGVKSFGAKSGFGASSPSNAAGSSKMSTRAGTSPASSKGASSDAKSSGLLGSAKSGKNKVTKFRYHKRITVRTTGKTSPDAVMDKVNKKDHKAGITPSTIEDMDPQELMKRAGIKGNKKTHWRVRLRQTKRMTKNGKTTTQTKVAYRDSEGNKRVKTSSNPFCKNCGKMLEQCKCDANSQS